MDSAETSDDEQGPEIVAGDGGAAEDPAAADRRRRTEKQREKRTLERKCGKCRKPATAGLEKWGTADDKKPQDLPICAGCQARINGDWQNLEDFGFSCPLDLDRPAETASFTPPPQDLSPALRMTLGRRGVSTAGGESKRVQEGDIVMARPFSVRTLRVLMLLWETPLAFASELLMFMVSRAGRFRPIGAE